MNTRKYSNKQEKQIAKTFNGSKQINSGATTWYKGDVATDYILFEAKTTTKEKTSFSIKEEWLRKNEKERFAMRKEYGVIAFNYKPNGTNYYVVNEKFIKDFIEMKKQIEGKE